MQINVKHKILYSQSDRIFMLVLLVTVCTRLVISLSLPIFNDEAIYLQWGWKELHEQHNLFYSLFDGKPPLLMWIFGIFESVFSNQLLSGRLVSLCCGCATVAGIYVLGKKYFSWKTGIAASVLYATLPIFIFYDAQALMESSLSCLGVWTCYFVLYQLETNSFTLVLLLSTLFSIGLFIKQTSIIFLFPFVLFSISSLYQKKNWIYRRAVIIQYLVGIILSEIILFPLYSQNNFHNIFDMNSRYAFSLREVFLFKGQTLLQNLPRLFELLFYAVTPVLTVFLMLGLYTAWKKKNSSQIAIGSWVLCTLLCFLLFIKIPSTRYIVIFLPLTTLFIADYILHIWHTKTGSYLSLISSIVSLFLTLLFLCNTAGYFTFLHKFTKYSDTEYINGWTSGVGIAETWTLLKKLSKKETIHVFVRHDYGNPEDAMFLMAHTEKSITVSYADFTCDSYERFQHSYFISRGNQLNNNSLCLKQIKRFYKPDNNEFIGVYQLVQSRG